MVVCGPFESIEIKEVGGRIYQYCATDSSFVIIGLAIAFILILLIVWGIVASKYEGPKKIQK